LRQRGVDIFFEKENIHTMSADGELLLTILASYAQEESRSVSENVKWRYDKQFKAGKMPLNQQRLYGYRRTADGGYAIVENEANIIRQIFARYLDGAGLSIIVRELNEQGILSPKGGRWNVGGLRYILSNERVIGDLLLQKAFIADHLTKKKKRNRGEKNRYYVENNHDAIISREIFDAVQSEFESRARKFKVSNEPKKSYQFTGKIICGICGGHYKRRTTRSGHKWQCNLYLTQGKSYCQAKQIPETILQEVAAGFNKEARHITALPDNMLRIEFADGTTTDTRWQDRSRRDSWTPEMKQAAREKSLKLLKAGA